MHLQLRGLFLSEDIIVNLNVFLTIGTGMEEHNNYAADFINVTRQIQKVSPNVHSSDGVRKLLFGFCDSMRIRESIHSVTNFDGGYSATYVKCQQCYSHDCPMHFSR